MSWSVNFAKRAAKELHRIPVSEQKRIAEPVDQLEKNPFSGDIQKIQGEKNTWRRRVGSYRIFFEFVREKKTIWIVRVERRTTSTY